MASAKIMCHILSAYVVLCSTVAVFGSVDEEKLLDDIFVTYNHQALPNKAWNDSVTVEIGVSLQKIQEVDEKENSITVMMWLHMEFMDNRLKWNPDEYGGLNKLRVPFENLWLPDIVLYNSMTESEFPTEDVDGVIHNNGRVVAISPFLATAYCEMDLALFPYDNQSCSLHFGSLTSSSSEIDLQLLAGLSSIETDSYSLNSNWELVNSSLTRSFITECCPAKQYVDITANLEISRRHGPYTSRLVIPSILTACLILFTFLLPSSSGEIIVFCLQLLLALLILIINLEGTLPSNSNSVLGKFLTFALFLDFFATIVAVVGFSIADPLMHDHEDGYGSKKHKDLVNRKMKIVRIAEIIIFFVFLLIFTVGTAVTLSALRSHRLYIPTNM